MSEAPPYELFVDDVPALWVHELRGTEKLSEAWRFDVTVTAPAAGPDLERAALGSRATLVLHTADRPRAFCGIVQAVRLVELLPSGQVRYRLRVVPRFALLRRRRRTRIFQGMRVLDIVATVLSEAGIGVQWQLVRPYPVRDYCTQYEETDEQFVRRLLAEAGIYFYFFTGGPSGAPSAMTDALHAGASVGAAASAVSPEAPGISVAAALATGLLPVPGDTLVCGDDAVCYPPVGHDDPAVLAAATLASLALGPAEALGAPGVSVASGAAAAIVAALDGPVPTFSAAEHDAGQVTRRDTVGRFSLQTSLRPSGAVFREYDPDRPLSRLQSLAVSSAPFPPSPTEAAAMAAAAAANAIGAAQAADNAAAPLGAVAELVGAAARAAVPNEVYDHHGHFLFPRWDYVADMAPRALRQERRRASVATGETGNATLSPAHRFQLVGHSAAHLDGVYAVVRVEHRGSLRAEGGARGGSYSNRIECVPAVMTYPPPRPPRRSVQVALTATVVGPGAEEIHVDAKGRIKVQFHWDRDGRFDGQSSCWIRVMQPWGGAGWGAQFIPRVGMEVVVGFEGGDPDMPLVLGSLYNGSHPSPFPLPGDKTRSGWRTQSSPGGEGHNELSFQDAKGSEQIHLRAERDLDEVILNDHQTKVSRDRRSVVGGDNSDDTGGSSSVRVARDKSEIVGESYSLQIGDSRKLSIYGSDQEHVSESRATFVAGKYGLQAGGMSVMVGTHESPNVSETFVWGAYLLGADGNVELTSDRGIALRCGDSVLELTKDGVTVKAKTVSLEGTESVTIKGKGPSVTLTDEGKVAGNTLSLVSSKGSVLMSDQVEIVGTNIKMNCLGVAPTQAQASDGTPQTKKLSLVMSDASGKAHAGVEYMLTAGGARFEGSTDGDGKLELDVPQQAQVANIVLYVGGRPEGKQVRYRVAIEDLPEGTNKAALTRLRNLGYYWGQPSDSLDAAARQAIRDYQRAHDLPCTGEVDDATMSQLSTSHGH